MSHQGSSGHQAPSTFDLLLYALVVLVWGTSWIAISAQQGTVAPEVSVLWRFVIACPVMFAWAVLAGQRLTFTLAQHATFAGLGATLFCTNFVLFYRASMSLPSGLMAVVFSLASVFNLVLSATVLRQPFDKRILLAGFMGTLGIALMFAPEMGGHGLTRSAEVGLLQSLVATLSFCLANIISSASQRRGIPVLSSTAWGMLYGIGYLTLLSLAMGNAFIIDGTFHYLFALVWLALVASVIAFSSYLTVLGRIGPARAGYMAVLFPVVALIVSTLYEGYTWTVLAVIGLILVSVGNLIALRK